MLKYLNSEREINKTNKIYKKMTGKITGSTIAFLITVIILLPLLSTSVGAASFSVSVSTIDNVVLPGETAQFNITIYNYGQSTLRIQPYTIDPQWSSKVDPPLIMVPPEGEATATLELKPHVGIPFGTRGIQLMFRELNSGAVFKQGILVRLKNPESYEGEYVPSVQLSIAMPEEVDPEKSILITIALKNRNPLNLSTLETIISSDLFNKVVKTPLAPLGEYSDDYTFNINPLTPPGEHNLVVSLRYNNQTVNQANKKFYIKAITKIDEKEESTSGLFKKSTKIIIANKGNVEVTKDIRIKTNLWKGIFTSYNIEPELEKGYEGTYYKWTVRLKPTESKTIEITQNYLPLAIIILLMIISLVAYYFLRSPLTGIKEVVAISNSGEGGSSEMKVRIFVKNRSSQMLRGVTIIDTIPKIAEYEKKSHLGSLSPTKVVKDHKKTTLKWELDVLEPFEERVLVYNIKSKWKIIGKISLPSAKMKYVTKSGKERVSYTLNRVILEENPKYQK